MELLFFTIWIPVVIVFIVPVEQTFIVVSLLTQWQLKKRVLKNLKICIAVRNCLNVSQLAYDL